jgi:hypothetical protein
MPSNNFTPEKAKKAANERWHPSIPRATHSGILIIGGKEILCDVLEDGRRVLRHNTVSKAMGKGKPSGEDMKRALQLKIPLFLSANNLTPYLEPIIQERGQQIYYKSKEGRKLIGYEANILPEACKVYVKAFNDGVLQKQQIPFAKVCQTMLYGLASVGITALVDDATGFIEKRNRDELQKILEKYISEELREWTRKFPNEFFKQVYRLHGWEYGKRPNHPQYVGKIINKHIYEKLPPGILDELKNKNPVMENGYRKHRHHQYMREGIGEKNLDRQIVQTITLMKISQNLDQFEEMVKQISPVEIEI